MAEATLEAAAIAKAPDIAHLVTEDDTPVDNLFSAKQQRLLVEPLYTSWQPDRPFVADANVGIFRTPRHAPIVPDMFLSLDVEIAENWYAKELRSYFLWEFGKAPDVVVEVVSNTKGQEADKKLAEYARLGVWYYAIYDPQQLIQDEALRVHELHVGEYALKEERYLEKIGLGLRLWDGVFEAKEAQWLRWCDADGIVLPTGAERAERLAAQLRALGIEPEV